MPSITLVSGDKQYKCLFSKRDQDLVSQFSWSLHSEGYAVANEKINGKLIYMHRLVLGVIYRPEVEVDHIFHNKLDNRRSKIRVCTPSQNRRNARKMKPGTSSFKGVYRDGSLYHAQITIDKKTFNLGRYRSEIAGAKAYDRAARALFENFAYLNFPAEVFPVQLTMSL